MADPFAADLARKGYEDDDEAGPPTFLSRGPVDPFSVDLARKGFGEPETPGRQFSPGVQSYNENVKALSEAPRLDTSVLGSLKQVGRAIGGGVKALGHVGLEEAKSLPHSAAHMWSRVGEVGPSAFLEPREDYLTANPGARRELERGVSDTVTFGLAEKAARAVDPESFGPQAAAVDAQAAPGVRTGAGVVGAIALPNPVSATLKAGGAVGGAIGSRLGTSSIENFVNAPVTGVLPNIGRGIAQYEATAPVAAAIQAEPGHRIERAAEAATDPAGLIISGGLGATTAVVPAAKRLLQKKAEDRMVDQAIKDIAGSKETGVSKPTDRRQIAKMIEPIKEEMKQADAIKIADTARNDPAQAWEMVQKKVDSISQDRQASYAAIDSETGGFRINDLRRHLADEVKRLGSEPGQATERQAVEAMIKDIDETWGNTLNPKRPTLKLRQYVTKLQRVAADTMGGLEETRRVQILDHVSGLAKKFLDTHLDDAAKADPSLRVVVDGLRDQNRRVAAWLSLEDALKTRASKIETNRMVDNKTKILGGGLAAAAAAQHFLHSPGAAALAGGVAVAPYVLPPIDRAVTRGLAGMGPAAANPAGVARLIQAARAGASPADLRAQAERDGVPVELADNLSAGR